VTAESSAAEPQPVTDDAMLRRSLSPEEAEAWQKARRWQMLERVLLAVVAAVQSVLMVFLASQ
jgi:hypothetical protein